MSHAWNVKHMAFSPKPCVCVCVETWRISGIDSDLYERLIGYFGTKQETFATRCHLFEAKKDVILTFLKLMMLEK